MIDSDWNSIGSGSLLFAGTYPKVENNADLRSVPDLQLHGFLPVQATDLAPSPSPSVPPDANFSSLAGDSGAVEQSIPTNDAQASNSAPIPAPAPNASQPSNPALSDVEFDKLRLAAFAVPIPNMGTTAPPEETGARLWLPPTGFGPAYYVDEVIFQKAMASKDDYATALARRISEKTDVLKEDHFHSNKFKIRLMPISQ